MTGENVPWKRVPEPSSLNGGLRQVLASVDSLQASWAQVISRSSQEEFREARRRSLRRHAIETGIIERRYDVEWGVTEALVAEGLTAEVAEREGGVDAGALETIRAQFDALGYVAEVAAEGQPLTVTLIRSLHAALCRTQPAYSARDQFGRPVERPLRLGSWKETPDFAITGDGETVEFTPPEHVPSEIDRLLELDAGAADLHPVIRASWLHYGLVAIHPFDDGNGRVARALALLVLLRARYAPLVVDRYARPEYLRSLEQAGRGDLRDLVRLFARLEVVALRSELERPVTASASVPAPASGSDAVEVARAYVDRLRALRELDSAGRATAVADLATGLNGRVAARLRVVGDELAVELKGLDPKAAASVYLAAPPDERAGWWKAQIVRTARRGGFFANLTDGSWWSYLRLTVLGQQLRFVVVTQKVGRGETGVLAVTVFAESVPVGPTEPDAVTPPYTPLLAAGQNDSVTLVHTDDLEVRWPDVVEVVERTLAAAVANFAESLA